jgi:hypothetical protein
LEFVDGFICWLFEKYRQDKNCVHLIMVENMLAPIPCGTASRRPLTTHAASNALEKPGPAPGPDAGRRVGL